MRKKRKNKPVKTNSTSKLTYMMGMDGFVTHTHTHTHTHTVRGEEEPGARKWRKYANDLSKKANKELILFTSTYLVECALSTLTMIKRN